MKRITIFSLILLLPGVVSAAALGSTVELFSAIQGELKPVSFSVSNTFDAGGRILVRAEGQRESGSTEKAWTTINIEWSSKGEWMKSEVQLRLKAGKAYFRVVSASGSKNAPALPAFHEAKNIWYELDASDPAVRAWFFMNPFSSDLATLVRMDTEKFQKGYSYTLHSLTQASASRGNFSLSVPRLLTPAVSSSIAGKIDTNLSNQFQYATLAISDAFTWKSQRQFHAVYVETPATKEMLSSNALISFFFGDRPLASTALSSSSSSKQAVSSSAQSVVVNRSSYRQVARSIVDLHGPDGINKKISARVAMTPLRWNSRAEFEQDFSEGRGVIYRYEKPARIRVSAEGAYAAFDVMFFDQFGRYISSDTVPMCGSLGCPVVTPLKPATFVLETRLGFLGRTGISSLWRLSLDWLSTPGSRMTHQQADRTAVRALETRLEIPAPGGWKSIESLQGDQSFRVLAETTARKLRLADIEGASKSRMDEQAAYRLYTVLVDTIRQNNLQYAFLVIPTAEEDRFVLVIDSYSFAPVSALDVNGNGIVDPDEKSAAPGTSYQYPSFTKALTSPVFERGQLGNEGVYVPVYDDNGRAIGVLALVRPVSK